MEKLLRPEDVFRISEGEQGDIADLIHRINVQMHFGVEGNNKVIYKLTEKDKEYSDAVVNEVIRQGTEERGWTDIKYDEQKGMLTFFYNSNKKLINDA